jgi:hypothetical protein
MKLEVEKLEAIAKEVAEMLVKKDLSYEEVSHALRWAQGYVAEYKISPDKCSD